MKSKNNFKPDKGSWLGLVFKMSKVSKTNIWAQDPDQNSALDLSSCLRKQSSEGKMVFQVDTMSRESKRDYTLPVHSRSSVENILPFDSSFDTPPRTEGSGSGADQWRVTSVKSTWKRATSKQPKRTISSRTMPYVRSHIFAGRKVPDLIGIAAWATIEFRTSRARRSMFYSRWLSIWIQTSNKQTLLIWDLFFCCCGASLNDTLVGGRSRTGETERYHWQTSTSGSNSQGDFACNSKYSPCLH